VMKALEKALKSNSMSHRLESSRVLRLCGKHLANRTTEILFRAGLQSCALSVER